MKIGHRIFSKGIMDELSPFLGTFGTIDNKHIWSDGRVGAYSWARMPVHESLKILIIKCV